MKLNWFAKYSWGMLAYNILVILWGALVRATGAGAGCGKHWPLCDGEVIPIDQQLDSAIEFTHRVTSGLAFISAVVLIIWAFRLYPKGDKVRLGSTLTLIFMITESAVGAALVLMGWVAGNVSLPRIGIQGVHLANTFMLVGSMVLTAWWASGGEKMRLKGQGLCLWLLGGGLVAMLIMSVAGAITALGDTLFRVGGTNWVTIVEVESTIEPGLLLDMGVIHPVMAVIVSLYLFYVARWLLKVFSDDETVRRLAWGLMIVIGVQLGAGLLNIVLRVPLWLQLTHLALADAAWILLVLISATVLTVNAE